MSDSEWRKWCDASSSLPVTCDPVWANAILSIPSAPKRAIPFMVADATGEALIVGFQDRRAPRNLTLSPLGLSAAFDNRGDKRSAASLLNGFLEQERYRWRSIAFVRPSEIGSELDSLASPDVVFSGETHQLSLSGDYDELFLKSFRGATRTCIRRAEDQGVQVKIATTPAEVHEYFRVHSELAAAKGGYVDLYPESVFSQLIQSKRVQLIIALAGDRVIGGGVFLDDGQRTFYWHAAADRSYAQLQPAYAILSYAIRDSISRGKKTMDFGSSAGIESLRRFKESWGAVPVAQTSVTYSHPLVRRLKALKRT